MISNRTLREWRMAALIEQNSLRTVDSDIAKELLSRDERIIRLTQELMDINLMKGEKK